MPDVRRRHEPTGDKEGTERTTPTERATSWRNPRPAPHGGRGRTSSLLEVSRANRQRGVRESDVLSIPAMGQLDANETQMVNDESAASPEDRWVKSLNKKKHPYVNNLQEIKTSAQLNPCAEKLNIKC